MGTLAFGLLHERDIDRIRDIDRSEIIDALYAVDDGKLVLREHSHTSPPWTPEMVERYVERARAVVASGGVAFGAWDGPRLVGIAVLDVRPVGDDPSILNLDFLHVSDGYRGRGISSDLMRLIRATAIQRGARALYISATPTRNTVDVYRHMGATVIDAPDPAMFAREPEDIHLILSLR
ncbi:MAG TPA: GNAT family N-acetyltransferase [Thermomicrobiales bacterium]|nr:GNAT family N-acetyltransferase [Thermomicrobiales bacterium]